MRHLSFFLRCVLEYSVAHYSNSCVLWFFLYHVKIAFLFSSTVLVLHSNRCRLIRKKSINVSISISCVSQYSFLVWSRLKKKLEHIHIGKALHVRTKKSTGDIAAQNEWHLNICKTTSNVGNHISKQLLGARLQAPVSGGFASNTSRGLCRCTLLRNWPRLPKSSSFFGKSWIRHR